MDPISSFNPIKESKSSTGSQFVDFLQTLVVFLAIGTFIYLFIAQPHKVSGPSMYPTFKDGDYIISDKISYSLSKPQKGDIIVFKSPEDHSFDFIKRIIATPGDSIKISNNQIFINGQILNEPYLEKSVITETRKFLSEGVEKTIPEGNYIVFGDNRENSSDSRTWGFIKREEILGKVFLRYWPANSIGINPGKTK